MLPAAVCAEPVPLGAIFWEDGNDTEAQQIDAGEVAVRLYANALNNLAHGGDGLDAAIHLTTRTLCFRLRLGELTRVGTVIRSVLADTR